MNLSRNTGRIIGLFVCILLLSGCLKKVEGTDQLNTNIFDREYAGDQWFLITGYEQATNALGMIKTRVSFEVLEDKIPDLKPSDIQLMVEGSGFDPEVISYPLAPGGTYKGEVDLPYVGEVEYCLTLGIYVSEEKVTINSFTDCFNL